jgi:hypothetical protein
VSGHFVQRCVHGVVVSTCRCMSKDRQVIIVDCPDRCTAKKEP